MSSSDLENLISMGFEKPRAELALRKSSGIQGAIDWLEKNQDTSTDALLSLEDASTAEDQDFGTTPLNPGEEAKSLLCKDCGRKLRSVQAAEFHAEKTQHTNFEESTEEVTPLTEKEKKEKLEELRQKLAAKRAGVFDQDKADKKRNEDIRRKTTKDSQDIKEELRKKELLKDGT
ncbi:uncharacterized protein KY384_006922 [Bacidia gigantensis]|uniref:uncharacterized protein n=1 Tax=Bacidia gigantensis TaxID=2732470 RepID=UPI001D03D11C|nr:uncharacterized protein KY384_006922 [Bacidia gigantensis]KAG8528006.1 hypothetical protein KY384_006922 [Bacidia gigantensis]